MDRVSDGERDAAFKAVEEAFASGRIVQADRDTRMNQLGTAQTPDEVRMIVHDLPLRDPAATWTTYAPPPAPSATETTGTPTPTPTQPPVHVPYGPATPSSASLTSATEAAKTGNLKALLLIPVAVVLVIIIGVTLAIVSAVSDTSGDGIDVIFGDSTTDAPPKPQIFTADGYADLLAALDSELGSTEVFSAVVYPEYAVMDVPAESDGKRQISYYYNGELSESTKGTSSYERFDLASIDPTVLLRITNRARMLVEDPTSYYAIIRKPGPPFDDGGWITAYASNEFGESGYLMTDKEGKVIRRYVSGE